MGLNDVSDAFTPWLETYTGTRTAGTYVNGNWVAGTPSALSFRAVMQNATPTDLKVVDEGLRTSESIKIHTTTQLIAQSGTTTVGDKINYESAVYLVHNVANRKIGNYYKAIAIRQ